MAYKKVSELDVLSAFGNIEIIGQYWIPKYLIAQQLGTSMYQINKQCKKLMEQGYLRKEQIEPYHDIEYETGIDYGNSLKVWITEITDKGIDKLKAILEDFSISSYRIFLTKDELTIETNIDFNLVEKVEE